MGLNFLNYLIPVGKLAYLCMIFGCGAAVVFLKKANRKGRYFFVQSVLAWFFTPKRVFIGKKNTLFDVKTIQKKKEYLR